MEINEYIATHIKDDTLLIDIGCGNKRFSKDYKNVITIDAWDSVTPDYLLDLEQKEDLIALINLLKNYNRKNIVVIMIDFIEHLDKDKGIILLDTVKKYVDEIILATPTVWSDNKHNVENPKLWCYGNQYDLHKSQWDSSDFGDFNEVSGIENHENMYVGVWNNV
jgi:hypothetical protein